MPVFDIWSRRKRRAEQREPDVYQYDAIPEFLRRQVALILDKSLGDYSPSAYVPGPYTSPVASSWQRIWDTMRREKGVLYLSSPSKDPKIDCLDALLEWTDTDDWLSLVEVAFFVVNGLRRYNLHHLRQYGVEQDPNDAINELNFRLRDACVGYQFEAGQILRIDAQWIHSEVVKPALSLLADPRFKGPQEEFLSAHVHYRAGEHEDAIADAGRAFESTMKAICQIRGWPCPGGARASDLIKIIRANGLLPDYLDQSFDQLIATLKSGLPKVRNEAGAHGQGASPRVTPGYLAAYALHVAAANIVLLVEALKADE